MKTITKLIFILPVLLLAACQTVQQTPTETVVSAPKSTAAEVELSPTPEPTPQQMKSYDPIFEPANCPMQLPAGQTEGKTVECGYLIIPENRFDPDSRDIRLAVAVFHPPEEIITPDPVIYLSGGPGASALELLYLSFDDAFGTVLETGRDMIVFDQRGVGLSEPNLDCPAWEQL